MYSTYVISPGPNCVTVGNILYGEDGFRWIKLDE